MKRAFNIDQTRLEFDAVQKKQFIESVNKKIEKHQAVADLGQ